MRRSSTAGRDTFHTAIIKGGADNTVNGKGMDNYVATTKYSMLTFLPKALYEQVRVFEPSLCPSSPTLPQLLLTPICAQRRLKLRAHELTGELDIVLLGSFGAWPMCTSPWWLCSPARRCLPSPTTPPSPRWCVPPARIRVVFPHRCHPASPLTPGQATLQVLVIGLSVAKEGYEDWKRYKADKQVNESIVLVWRGSSFERCRWQELAVGEIVKVRQTSPCLPP